MNVTQMVSHLVQAGDLPFTVSLPDKSSFFFTNIYQAFDIVRFAYAKGGKNLARNESAGKRAKTAGIQC